MAKNWSKSAKNRNFSVTIKLVTNGLHMVTNWLHYAFMSIYATTQFSKMTLFRGFCIDC